MRRALLTVAVVGLIWIGYMAWPVYDLLVLLRAVKTRDVESVVRHVRDNATSDSRMAGPTDHLGLPLDISTCLPGAGQ